MSSPLINDLLEVLDTLSGGVVVSLLNPRVGQLASSWVCRTRTSGSTGPTAGAMPVEVFDRGLVSPRDLIDGHVEHAGDFLSFVGRGGPAAEGDRRHSRFIEAGAFGQLGESDLL